jgi:uncharacterized protein YdeI (YjbR/CyaY-like superfamily)
MKIFKDIPVALFDNQVQWRDWLEDNHQQAQGIWLKLAKKSSGVVSVSYAEALEEALCYGWIDSQKQGYDDNFWLQKFTPRGIKSIWSKVNVKSAEILIDSGRMKPAGLESVELAKHDGRWQAAYDSPATNTIPEDFQVALDKNPEAKRFFETLNKANTYAFCWRIQTAKKPETRKARIEKFIDMLSKNEKLH